MSDERMVAGPAWPETEVCAPAGDPSTALDSEAEWPQVWLLHGAVFPLILLAVLAPGAASRQRTPNFRELLALIPWPALLLIGLALIYVLATFVLFIPESAGGAPIIKDGRFFFNDHGVVREVTESEFHFQRSVLLRIYSSVWTYLYLVAAIVLLCARRAPKTEPQCG